MYRSSLNTDQAAASLYMSVLGCGGVFKLVLLPWLVLVDKEEEDEEEQLADMGSSSASSSWWFSCSSALSDLVTSSKRLSSCSGKSTMALMMGSQLHARFARAQSTRTASPGS